jgi:hypothetical protein
VIHALFVTLSGLTTRTSVAANGLTKYFFAPAPFPKKILGRIVIEG